MSCCFSVSLVLLLAIVPVPFLHAQTPGPVTAAAASITPEMIARHLRVLAADSFQRRGTPSPALERAARYVADQFARLGLLRPAGDQVRKRDSAGQYYRTPDYSWAVDSLWLQRYPVPGQQRLDYAQSGLQVSTILTHRGKPVIRHEGGFHPEVVKTVTVDFRTTVRLASEVRPVMAKAMVGERGSLPVTLLSGPHTLASVRQAQLHQQVILWVLAPGGDSAQQQQVLAELAAENHVVLLRDDDSAGFARRRAAALAHPPVLVDDYLNKRSDVHTWIVEVWSEALRPVLAAAGLDWAALRAARTPEMRPLPFTRVSATWAMAQPDSAAPVVTAPNVVGVLRGTGVLRDGENFQGFYVVISAPLDDGSDPGRADGPDSSAAAAQAGGLAGLLALAEAFSLPGMQPRFSVVFLATSGSGPGLWGSNAYLQSKIERLENGQYLAHLGLDRLGRAVGDSVWLGGLEDFDFAVSPVWTVHAHPELRLTVVPDDRAAKRAVDHVAFAARGVPSLSVRGVTAGQQLGGDTVAGVDVDYAARVARAALYVGWDIVNAERGPRWKAAGRRRFLGDGSP